MKYITFVVPCYNSENYMNKCIDSLLIGKEKVEIIIIDDGSKDNTGKIADTYKEKYPDIIKVVHQENGGHGEGINTGLKHATGKYFKVIDSDDWVNEKAYKKLLEKIEKIDSDLIITNYVYTYNEKRKNKVINFSNVFKENEELTWNDMKKWKYNQYPSIHSVMYKKSVLDKTNITLPKHIFYEDNLFVYLPLINTKTIYYLNINLYQYYIGRPDQSVQDTQLIKRSHHQVLVTRLACTAYDLNKIENKNLRKLMKRECAFLMTIAITFSRLEYTKEREAQYKELWETLKKENPNLYKNLRHFTMASLASTKGPIGRFITQKGFKIAHKILKFN